MQLFFDFYVFTRFWLNLSDRNLELFSTSKQNNFRFRSSKFSQKHVKTQKSRNNRMSSFGLIEKNMELSHIFLAVFVRSFFAMMGFMYCFFCKWFSFSQFWVFSGCICLIIFGNFAISGFIYCLVQGIPIVTLYSYWSIVFSL